MMECYDDDDFTELRLRVQDLGREIYTIQDRLEIIEAALIKFHEKEEGSEKVV